MSIEKSDRGVEIGGEGHPHDIGYHQISRGLIDAPKHHRIDDNKHPKSQKPDERKPIPPKVKKPDAPKEIEGELKRKDREGGGNGVLRRARRQNAVEGDSH